MSAETVGDRIKTVRGGVSQVDFAKKYGLNRNTLARYENGTNDPSASFLKALIEDFELDANWLLLGEGEPPKQDPRKMILLSHFDACDERGKDAMLTAGSALAKPKENMKKKTG